MTRLNTTLWSILASLCWLNHSSAQWMWQNPKPTGNDLRDIQFIDAKSGWFVGGNGTVFGTTNGGIRWIQKNAGPEHDISCLRALDANHLWMATGNTEGDFDYFSVLFSPDGGDHWVEQINGAQLGSDILNLRSYSIWDIQFLNESVGWAVGDTGLILRTSDGGTNWNVEAKLLDYELNSIHFFNDSLGYMCGGRTDTVQFPSPTPLSVSKGIILKTTSGGAEWDTIYTDTISIGKIFFLNSLNGWALGSSLWFDQFTQANLRYYILRTTDGGLTWQKERFDWVEDIVFIDGNRGWAVGPWGEVLVTTDGGGQWTYTNPTQRFINRLHRIQFSDSLHGYIVGSDGAILQSTDAGQTWSHYDRKFREGIIDDIFFVNPDTGWFAQSDLYRTADGGDSWNPSGLTGIRGIDCFDKNHCWACGYNGEIIYSSDVGSTWTPQTSGVTDELRAIKFVSPVMGWTGAGGTAILKTTNGGSTWFTQTTPAIGGLTKIVTQDTSRIWLYGTQAVTNTTNAGQSWGTFGNRYAMFFLNPDTGWAKGADTLLRTFDGARTWDTLGRPVVSIYNTQFLDANLGWTSFTKTVSKTTDGGYSWNLDLAVDVYHALSRIQFSDSTHGWAAGMMGGALVRYGYPEKVTSVRNNPTSRPLNYRLYQNFPNPFNPSTRINYTLATSSHVVLQVYDVLGRGVAILVNANQDAGYKSVAFEASRLPSGVYFYRLQAGNFSDARKMLLIR